MNNIYLLTGLSGSGKTTIANIIKDGFIKYILDGDSLRNYGGNYDFSPKGRRDNCFHAGMLLNTVQEYTQGNILVCLEAPTIECRRAFANGLVMPYTTILLDVDFEDRVRRDPKGLYAKDLKGELEEPMTPHYEIGDDIDFVIKPFSSDSPEETAKLVKKVMSSKNG